MVQRHRWGANGGKAVAGRGIRGGVVGWHLPAKVVGGEALSGAGVVVVEMGRVAVGSSAGACTQPVGIMSRRPVVQAHCQQEGVGGRGAIDSLVHAVMQMDKRRC